MLIGLLKIKYFDFNSYKSVCGITETTTSMAGSDGDMANAFPRQYNNA